MYRSGAGQTTGFSNGVREDSIEGGRGFWLSAVSRLTIETDSDRISEEVVKDFRIDGVKGILKNSLEALNPHRRRKR